jgi:hypothetical protein
VFIKDLPLFREIAFCRHTYRFGILTIEVPTEKMETKIGDNKGKSGGFF